MKMTTLVLASALALQCFAEEEIAAADPIVMTKLANKSGKMSPTERVTKLESEMKDVLTDTVRGQFGAKAASARPAIDSYRLFTDFDLLYWKQYEGGDDYAFTDHDGTSDASSIGANKHINFDWNLGFKTALGYHFPHDSWDALARYTWYQAHASNGVGVPGGGALQPLDPPYRSHTSDHASAHWKTKLSILDVEIGKSYFLSRHFSVAPFMGLKTAWIHQKMKETYTSYPSSGVTTYMKNRNDFWGIGPWGGINSKFHFGSMFNLFGSLASALMISSINVKTHEIQGVETLTDLKANVTRITPALQGTFGLGWEMVFNRSRNHIAVNFSYEAQYWWRQNQLLYFGAYGPAIFKRYSEDLGLHGVTLDLLFDF